MDARRFAVGTVAGGVTLYVTGDLIFSVALGAFYRVNAGSATGVDRSPALRWSMFPASLAYAALIAYASANRPDASSAAGGATVGAIVGVLLWSTADFTFYGSTNIANLTRTVLDPLLEIVHGGIWGAVIMVVFARTASVRPGRGTAGVKNA